MHSGESEARNKERVDECPLHLDSWRSMQEADFGLLVRMAESRRAKSDAPESEPGAAGAERSAAAEAEERLSRF